MRKLLFFFVTVIVFLFSSSVFAEKTDKSDYVNILSWWGYLSDPKIAQEVKSQCGVNISVDEYYTNEDFIKIFQNQNHLYDIAIFSNLAFDSVKDKISNSDSSLWKVAKSYHPYFKKYYFSHNYPHNVVFFSHAIMGFMYNPENMKISSNENIFTIFKSVKDNYSVIIDDQAEVRNFLTLGYKTSGEKWPSDIYDERGVIKLNYENFSRATQNSKVFVTNDGNKIYDLKKFALSFMWSGDAIAFIQKSKKPYKFILNKKLSYICSDLLAQLKETKNASCVAHVLEEPKVMSLIQNSTYYFTPYFRNDVDDSMFDALYKQTEKNLEDLPWINPEPDFSHYQKQWESIKFKLNEKNS